MKVKKNDKLKFIIFLMIMLAAVIFIVINWRTIRGLDIETVVDFVRKK